MGIGRKVEADTVRPRWRGAALFTADVISACTGCMEAACVPRRRSQAAHSYGG
jgi:hypothetical protein